MQHSNIIAGSHFKKVLGHSSLYMVANVLVTGGSALLLPIYTRELDPNQYAIFKNLISAGLVMAIVVSLHIDYAYSRFVVDHEHDRNTLRTLYSTLLWFAIGWGALICVAGFFVLRRWAVNSLGASAIPQLALACGIPLVSKLNVLAAAHFRSQHQSGIVALSSAAGFLSGAVISIVLLLVYDMGVTALLWGALCGPCIAAAWAYANLFRQGLIGFAFSTTFLTQSLRFSLGVLPMAGAAWIAGQADAIFVAELGDMKSSGVYSVAFDIGRLINLLVMSIFMAYTPMIYRMLKEDAPANIPRIEQFQAFLIHVMVGMAFFLSVLAPEIFALLVKQKAYYDGIWIVPVIAFAFVLGGVRKLHSAILYYHKITLLISIGGILQAAVSVGLNFLLIPRYGAVAAAWSKTISLGIAAIYCWCLTRKYQPLKFDIHGLRVTFTILLLCAAVIGACQYGLNLSFWPLLTVKLVVMLLALWWTWKSAFGDQMRTVLKQRKNKRAADRDAASANIDASA